MRRPGRRSRRVLLAGLGCWLAAAGVVGGPAVPAEAAPSGDPPPDGCVEGDGDIDASGSTIGSQLGLIGADRPYLQCDGETSGYTCQEIPTASNQVLVDGDFVCVSGDTQIVECRNDIRATWNPFDYDSDDGNAFFSGDHERLALIPSAAPEWWTDEIRAESEADKGMGCRLAENFPGAESCEQINDDKEELREEIDELESERDAAQDSESGDPGRYTDELQEKRDELRGLATTGGVIPDDCWGEYPTHHYQLTWDSSDEGLTDPSRLMGWLGTILFGFAKMAVSATLWLVRLAFTFDVTEYRHTVGRFASDIDQQLVHLGEGSSISLFDVAWFVLFAYAGFQALRGRSGRAGREIVTSIVLAGLGVVLIGNFFPSEDGDSFNSTVDTGGRLATRQEPAAYEDGGYFDSFGDMLNMSAVAMLRVAEGEDPDVERADATDQQWVEEQLRGSDPDYDRGVLGKLHDEFIERPYFYINYNRESFEEELATDANVPGDWYDQLTCAEVTQHLLAVPEKDGPWPTAFLRRNGCEDAAVWNGEMGVERLMATVLVTAVGVIVSVLIGLASITLLLSKFLVAVFFVALPLAVVMAILPGRTRQMAWGWATSLLQLWLAALGMGLVLALLMMGMDAITLTTSDDHLGERWIMILLLVGTIYMLRKRIVSGSQSAAKAVAEQMTSSTGSGGPSWSGAGGGSSTSLDLMGADRGAARAGAMGQASAMRAGAMAGSAARMGARVGIGGPYRTARQRLGENRRARKSQRWHWTNTLAGKEVDQARSILKGGPARAEALRDADQRHHRERREPGRREMREARRANYANAHNSRQRQWEHEVGKLDAGDVRGVLGTRKGQLTGDTAKAARRLGIEQRDIDAFNAAPRGGRIRTEPQATQDLRQRLSRRTDNAEAGLARRANRSAQVHPGQRLDAAGAQRLREQWNAPSPDPRHGSRPDVTSYRERERTRMAVDTDYTGARQRHQERISGTGETGRRLHERQRAERDWIQENVMDRDQARRFASRNG